MRIKMAVVIPKKRMVLFQHNIVMTCMVGHRSQSLNLVRRIHNHSRFRVRWSRNRVHIARNRSLCGYKYEKIIYRTGLVASNSEILHQKPSMWRVRFIIRCTNMRYWNQGLTIDVDYITNQRHVRSGLGWEKQSRD